MDKEPFVFLMEKSILESEKIIKKKALDNIFIMMDKNIKVFISIKFLNKLKIKKLLNKKQVNENKI